MNKHVNKVRKATGRAEAITAGRHEVEVPRSCGCLAKFGCSYTSYHVGVCWGTRNFGALPCSTV